MKPFWNILRIPNSRNRILFTLGCLAIYLVGGHIPIPRINPDILEFLHSEYIHNEPECFGTIDLANSYRIGNPMWQFSVLALGIGPYVIACGILLLFPVLRLHLYRLYKKGGMGRIKIAQYAWYLAFALSMYQAFDIALTLQQQSVLGTSFVENPGFLSSFTIGVTITAGFALVMWIADQITRHGVGYGIPLLIVTNIVVNILQALTGICL